MNTNIEKREELTNLEKFQLSLTKDINIFNERNEKRIFEYIFSSKDNNFKASTSENDISEINGFTIISKVQRFFYTIKNSQGEDETYRSNVILFKDESISFYKDNKLGTVFGKTEFEYEELVKLAKTTNGLNKKIIIMGIYDGKLTKIETSYTSEYNLIEFLSNENGDKTSDIKGVERTMKNRKGEIINYNILSFKSSDKQIKIPEEELVNLSDILGKDIEEKNLGLSSNDIEKRKEESHIESIREEVSNNTNPLNPTPVEEEVSFDYSQKPF